MFIFRRPVRDGVTFLLAASILQVTGLALAGWVSAREVPACEGFTSFMEVGSEAPGELLFSLPEVQSDPTIRAVQTRLLDAQKEAAALSETYGPDHPLLKAARVKVDLLRAKLSEALPRVVGSPSASPLRSIMRPRPASALFPRNASTTSRSTSTSLSAPVPCASMCTCAAACASGASTRQHTVRRSGLNQYDR